MPNATVELSVDGRDTLVYEQTGTLSRYWGCLVDWENACDAATLAEGRGIATYQAERLLN